jgi:hypothetical protein
MALPYLPYINGLRAFWYYADPKAAKGGKKNA